MLTNLLLEIFQRMRSALYTVKMHRNSSKTKNTKKQKCYYSR